MKKILLLFVIFPSIFLKSHSQNLYDLKQDHKDNLHQVYSTERLLLPHFVTGFVFIGKDSLKAWLNYDIYTNEMLFIDRRGDTFALSSPEKTDLIKVDKRMFRYVNGSYMEVLASNGKTPPQRIELYIKRTMIPSERKKEGAFGVQTDASNVKSMQIYDSQIDNSKNLEITEHTTFKRYNSFYIQAGKKLMKAKRKAFFKAFPYTENQLEFYLKDERVRYNNGDDLMRLFNYCVSIEPVKVKKKKGKSPQKSQTIQP